MNGHKLNVSLVRGAEAAGWELVWEEIHPDSESNDDPPGDPDEGATELRTAGR